MDSYISRKLPLPVDFFIHHSRTKRDLTLMPHTSPRDKVFELTNIFPNYKDRPSLWVVYNETSGYVIAYADILLRSSVNDYVYRYVDGMMKNNGVDFIELDMEGSSSRVILLIINAKYEILNLNN